MSRRRVVVLASAATLFTIVALLGFAVAMTTRTAWGREQIRSYVEGILNRSVKGGRWHLGALSGSLFTDLQVDSFSIRESSNDSLFIATGRVTVRFSPRDLWDRRIVVSQVTVEHPVVHIRQDSLGKWNYRKVFPSGPPGPKRTTRRFGDYIVLNEAALHDAQFHLVMPWRPADSLSGARRDSAIAFGLGRKDKRILRVSPTTFVQVKSWTRGRVEVSRARIADPDSAGRFFQVTRLDVDEFDPPMQFSNARGTVRILGDSLWADFDRFALPGSRGTASGKVWWGSDLPTRYDVHVRGDSVSMADVAWVYPTLPTTGGGRMDLQIRNEEDLHVLDYALTNMDVRTTGSRLRGAMTFGVGGPVLIVKDVAMTAEPIDWVLIEQLTGEPLPYPWKGKIAATLTASGGPVNRFTIEQAEMAFTDANVPGATARGRARGELDMLFPAFTKFKKFDVDLDRFDLETLQFLNANFPRLDGWISGHARLDSVWTDVRFSAGDITHHFQELPTSRVTGSGRVTLGEKFLTYDVALQLIPVELSTVAKAWPELLLEYRGALTGPARLQGTAEDLAVSAQVAGAQGRYWYDGKVDIDSVGGYAYQGTLRFADANLRALYDSVAYPVTALNGVAEVDIRGDSLENYVGPLALDLERSRVDSTRIYDGARGRFVFQDGKVRVDSLWAESPVGRLTSRGTLGLRADQRDSLQVRLESDSLGGLRPYLLRAATDSVARATVDADSLQGEVTANLVLAGSVDSLAVKGTVDGRAIMAYASTAKRARVTLDLDDVGIAPMHGTVAVTADSMVAGTIGLRHLALDATVRSLDSADVRTMVELVNGPTLDATAGVAATGDTTALRVTQGRIGFGDHEWSLSRLAGVRWWPEAFAIDSLGLVGNRGGRIGLHGVAPATGAADLRFTADSVALEDLAALGQLQVKLSGALTMDVRVGGTRLEPVMDVRGRLQGTKVGTVNLSETTLTGRYADRRLAGALGVLRGDTAVLSVRGNVPLDLALASRSTRLLDDTMRVALVSRDVDLKLVESFTPAVTGATGRLNADMAIAGRRGATQLQGFLRVDSAGAFVPDLGITVRDFFADLRAARDTIRIERFSMVSGETSRNALGLDGFIALDNATDRAFSLNLQATDFHVIDKRRVGDLTMSAGLRFMGRESASRLTGSLTVDNGYIVIPELTSKQIVNVDDPEFAALADTSLAGSRAVLPTLPKLLQGLTAQNVQIAMGSDVRLRSSEANIKLGGSVNVIRARALSAGGIPQLAVEGALRTERGTFLMRFGDVLLQRLFTIEGGEVRFFGDADFNPTLNISALYSVRQANQLYSQRNIRIRARLLGTLVQPRITLESADSLQLSQTDLIAYLLTSRPSADIGGLNNAGYYADLLLTNLGSSLSARYSGRFFDYLQLQAVSGALQGTGSARARQDLFAGLAGTQLGVGKQLNDRTFVSLTTGFCPLRQFLGTASTTTPQRVSDMIGGTIEYTIRSGLGVSVSREPPLASMLCGLESVGFAASRGAQLSFDIFRTWRW